MFETLIEVDVLNGDGKPQFSPPVPSGTNGHITVQSDSDIPEAETLLLVIEATSDALSRPMDDLMSLSESLLAQADHKLPESGADKKLVDDVRALAARVQYMKEIIRGLNMVSRYQNSDGVML